MKLSDAVSTAYDRKWSMINTFTAQIIFPTYLIDKVGINVPDESINLNIVSFETPDFTNEPIEVFVSNRWIIQNGRDTMYRFSITFRDYNQLLLYKTFVKIYNLTKENYFDSIKMSILIYKDPDWLNESSKLLSSFEGVLVDSVSNLSFSNETENQIAEFTVNFKTNNPIISTN